MTWNYRIIQYDVSEPNDPFFGIHEVRYDKKGKPNGYTLRAIGTVGESKEVIADTLDMMHRALMQPVLLESGFLKIPPITSDIPKIFLAEIVS